MIYVRHTLPRVDDGILLNQELIATIERMQTLVTPRLASTVTFAYGKMEYPHTFTGIILHSNYDDILSCVVCNLFM